MGIEKKLSRKRRTSRGRCGGSVYLVVLSSAVLVTIIGATALVAVKAQRAVVQAACDTTEARNYAQSGVDVVTLVMSTDANWRTNNPNGVWGSPNLALGSGSFTVSVVDPSDGNLVNSAWDPVLVTATGYKGTARQKVQVQMAPGAAALACLSTCIHASGQLRVFNSASLTVSGAPASTNGAYNGGGTLYGDVQAASKIGSGTVTGVATIPAPAKTMPDATTVINYYKGKATTISPGSELRRTMLGPGVNPWGTPNADGVYYVNMTGDLTVRQVRVYGTLIIKTNGYQLLLKDTVLIHNYRADYPSLIVDGSVQMSLDATGYPLTENDAQCNLNPSGSPYLGVSDTDQSDSYPNEIRGLVYINGVLTIDTTSTVRGVVICNGAVNVSDSPKIYFDPGIAWLAPTGFTQPGPMKVVAGTWKRVVD